MSSNEQNDLLLKKKTHHSMHLYTLKVVVFVIKLIIKKYQAFMPLYSFITDNFFNCTKTVSCSWIFLIWFQ